MGSLKGVFDIGAGIGEALEQAKACKSLLQPAGIVREVFLVRVAAGDESTGLRISDHDAVTIVQQRKEIPELKALRNAADDKGLEQAVGRRISDAPARSTRRSQSP